MNWVKKQEKSVKRNVKVLPQDVHQRKDLLKDLLDHHHHHYHHQKKDQLRNLLLNQNPDQNCDNNPNDYYANPVDGSGTKFGTGRRELTPIGEG